MWNNIDSSYSHWAEDWLAVNKQGYLDNPPRKPFFLPNISWGWPSERGPTSCFTLLHLISGRIGLEDTHTRREKGSMRVWFSVSVCGMYKMYLLLLGQLFWMPGPRSWLQTQSGCCLYVSAQPTTDKWKVSFNKNLVKDTVAFSWNHHQGDCLLAQLILVSVSVRMLLTFTQHPNISLMMSLKRNWFKHDLNKVPERCVPDNMCKLQHRSIGWPFDQSAN